MLVSIAVLSITVKLLVFKRMLNNARRLYKAKGLRAKPLRVTNCSCRIARQHVDYILLPPPDLLNDYGGTYDTRQRESQQLSKADMSVQAKRAEKVYDNNNKINTKSTTQEQPRATMAQIHECTLELCISQAQTRL